MAIVACNSKKRQEIRNSDKELNRKYTADFGVYRQKSQDPENAEVEMYIATGLN